MWTYILFGMAHGIFFSVSVSTSEVRDEFWKRRGQLHKKWLLYTRRLVTFSMVCFTMIFFRADSVGDAFLIIGNIFHPDMSYFNITPGLKMLKYSACLVLFGELVHLMQRAGKIKPLFFETPAWVRWPVYSAAVLAIFYLGELVTEQKFIYAQF
jgi:hypothetical protein